MFLVLILLLCILILDLTAIRWGYDSRDRLNSKEWERRRHWRGLL